MEGCVGSVLECVRKRAGGKNVLVGHEEECVRKCVCGCVGEGECKCVSGWDWRKCVLSALGVRTSALIKRHHESEMLERVR